MSRSLPLPRVAALLTAAVLIVALAACSSAGSTPGTMTATDAWARPSTSMDLAGAAYVTITNGTGTDDALVGASSPAAQTVEVHETVAGDSGMMGMQPVGSVPIPAGGALELKPGAYHIMLIDLTQELKAGDTIQLTLTFEKAAPVTVTAEVRPG
jgi:copper(I)-binding protein